MSVATSRAEFVAQMQQEFAAHSETQSITVSNPPSAEHLRRYFRLLRGRTQDAIDAYRGYASQFYVHVADTSSPTADVTYPGSGSNFCDSWSEVLARPIVTGQRVIDCEGFSVMGAELLREAGFTFVSYRVAVPNVITPDWEGHAIAQMRDPEGRYRFVGNDQIYNSLARAVEGLDGWNPQDEATARYGSGATIREAMEDADEIVRERREARYGAHEDIVAPFRRRSRVSPPTRDP